MSTPVNLGPVALTTTLTTNIVHPAAAGASAVGYTATATKLRIRHIRIVNKTGSSATFSLWLGATGANAAGTEVVGTAQAVAANSAYDWYGDMVISSTQYLVGGAGTATALTFTADGIMELED